MASGKLLHIKMSENSAVRLKVAQQSQQVSAKSLDISKVVRLLEDPLTTNMKEKHLFVLRKLFERNHTGFLLRELTGMSRVLNVCAEKAKDHPEYAAVLCEALKICGLPFLKERVSDEMRYAQDATEILSHIGYLMRVSHDEVKQHVVECVKSFYNYVTPPQLLDGLQQTSLGYKLQLLERSDLPKTLLLSMAALENQPAIKLQLLQTLQILSSSSDKICTSIVEAHGAETICLHMNEPGRSSQVLFCSSEILWNLLESGNKEEIIGQLSSMECVISLKEAFCHLLLKASQTSDLQLRNDLLVITTFIAGNPNSPLVESLFTKQLVGFVMFPEMKRRSPLDQNLKLTYSNKDLKMKKLLLNLLVVMSRDCAALQLYEEEMVMLFLLKLIKPLAGSSERRSGLHHWSVVQQEELQLQALATLTSIAPLMLDDYMSCQGNACLLLLLDWCVRTDAYFAHGHSFHGTGGRGSKKAQLRYCIRVLKSVTSLGEESVNQDLCDQGIISQLLGVLNQMDGRSDEEDEVTTEIMSNIQLILSSLCETDIHRKELFGSEGVEMTVHFLKKGSSKFYSGLGHNKLLLSTIDCVRSCIVGCCSTEDYFLAKDGAFLLLSLLSTSPRCVHGVVLSTLLELHDNPNTPSLILSWRDAAGQTASRLLLQLWREEEKELGVIRNQHGGITDPQSPVLSCFQQDGDLLSFPAATPTTAVLEISENLRAKIYLIFCCLGFQGLPGLSTEDYVTLSIIKRYLDFKVGEVWEEISRELSLDGVRPISPDEEALSTIQRISEDTARRIMAEQRSILEQQQEEDISEEKLVYREMKSRLRQQELTSKSWNKYVSKTSNYEILKEEKAQREKHAALIRSKPNHPAKHFIGHVVAMESTDLQGPAGMKVMLAKAPIRTEPAPLDLVNFSTVKD
ncbi:cilia- and flagella-associated protein 69-like isoform X2 [Melanotaenia boesemani]|uniref:cilia- and flagella-associated protein 69-like isoform X2 n=1 Tax=Melanotaenia boesemani TaxID=1250792 RepID=UPI001C0585C1|nr:cilia- and flagella-associated protein 69-like isoform X2 [Melanotaenia boesemani]